MQSLSHQNTQAPTHWGSQLPFISSNGDEVSYYRARQLANRILGNNKNKIEDYLHSKKFNYQQLQPEYEPTFYQQIPSLEFRTELPDRTQNVTRNPLSQKAIDLAFNSLIKRVLSSQGEGKHWLSDAKSQSIKNLTANRIAHQEKQRSKGISESGNALLQNIVANQHHINRMADASYKAATLNQEARSHALKQLADYGLKLDHQRFEQDAKLANQQSEIDSIEADLFNKHNQLLFEHHQDVNRRNTQLQNEAMKYNQEQKQQITNLNTEANINKFNKLWESEKDALKEAYDINLNRDKVHLDRFHKISDIALKSKKQS